MTNHVHIPNHLFSMYFQQIVQNKKILPTHIGLLMALFYYHEVDKPLHYFRASRRNLMKFSKIRSTSTYHKCLHELIQFGYLEYFPSYHPKQASKFRFIGIPEER